jgi:hypothetical protein
MGTPDESGASVAWFPATVGSAYRRGTAAAADLSSGAAFEDMLAGLRRAAALVGSERAPDSSVDQAAGYRHLLVLLGLAVDEALRPSNPYDPFFAPANVDAVLKWGMDCPDAAYTGAALRGDGTYRIRGRRGTVRYLGFQVMSGIESSVNVVADDLDLPADGSFEITLSEKEQPGNWMALSPRTSSLVVRQFFYDWDAEEPAHLEIECLEPGPSWPDPEPLSAAGVARQLVAIGEFMEASIAFWLDVEDGGRAQGINVFRQPAALTAMGAAAENVSVWGSWELDDDHALVIEVTPPEALYWSVSLGNHWWETIDYANRQSSLNGHQAVVDGDGVFRAVVSHTDPGVANWLDTAGHSQGPMIFRWLRAQGAPVPTTRVVSVDEVEKALPSGTVRVDPAQRRATIARRRVAVRRRFPR